MNPRVDGPHMSPEDRSSPTRATGAGAASRAPAPTLSKEWRVIPGYPSYEVSEDGRVRRAVASRTTRPRELTGTINQGYRRYNLVNAAGHKKHEGAHRLVAWAFLGPAPSADHQIAHSDGNRQHNHWTNLRWATCQENHMDRIRHGHGLGETNNYAKLTAQLVTCIRADHSAARLTFKELGRRYGITPGHAHAIVSGRLWRHV